MKAGGKRGKWKGTFIFIAFVMVVLLNALSGCVGGAADGQPESSMAAGSSDAPLPAGQSETLPFADQPEHGHEYAVDFSDVTLRIYYGTSLSEGMMTEIIKDFKEETGATLMWESAGEGLPVLKARFAAGEAPDLFSCNSLVDMEKWSERIYPLNTQPWVDLVYDSALAAATGADGTLYALPISSEAAGIIYNKDLFRRAGITELPETLYELENVCNKLKSAGIQPFGECYALPGFAGQTLSILFAYQEDRRAGLSHGLANKTKTLMDFNYIDQWFRYVDLTVDNGVGSLSASYDVDDQIADFVAGNMAMMRQGTWLEEMLISMKPPFDFGLMPVPLTDDAADCKLMVSVTNFLSINKDSPNIEAALYFLEWLQKNADKYPVRLNNLMTPYKNSSRATLGALNRDMAAYMERGESFGCFGWEYWPTNYSSDVLTVLQQYILKEIDKKKAEELLTLYYRRRVE